MDFSQSLRLGNSTFMKLASEENRAVNNVSYKQDVEAILESSNSEKNNAKTNSKYMECHDKQIMGRRKGFQRCKSDSTILITKKGSEIDNVAIENCYQFFNTNVSFTFAETNDNYGLKTSNGQLKGTSKNLNQMYEECSHHISQLNQPICTEEINQLIEIEKENPKWDENLKKLDCYKCDILPQLDEASFLYPLTDGEIDNFLDETNKYQYQDENENINIKNKKKISFLSSSSNTKINAGQDSVMIHNKSKYAVGKTNSDKTDYDKLINLMANMENTQAEEATETITNKLEFLKDLSVWNLPSNVVSEYKRKGVKEMFNWQVECLSNPKVLFQHHNLVYSAPTSAGKTLVSEILLLKTIVERKKKVILILPFISVVREKMQYLQDLLNTAGYRVEGFFGGYSPPGGFDNIDIAICTIEKANSIVNKLMEHGKIDDLGTIIVDEVHLISDPSRGYILELLLTKILYISRKFSYQIQIITMSATLANVELLKVWLDAEVFITNFRPVALQEMIKIGPKIYDSNMKLLRDVSENKELSHVLKQDSDNVAQLCLETILEGCSVIVFCPSRDWCENLAVQLANSIQTLAKSCGDWSTRLKEYIKRDSIDDIKQQLRDIPTGLDELLNKTITYGCAFHHAGLTTEERDIIEVSFKKGILRIMVATSTLSSGVNLPARRVLIRSPLFSGKQMDSLTYKQMIGRAGRTGKDTEGESILICTENNARIGQELIRTEIKPISSCLEMDSSTHLKRALLEVIAIGVASNKQDILNFVGCTLLSTQKLLKNKLSETSNPSGEYINEALQFLIEYEFIRTQSNNESTEENYVATRLGLACLASSMPPTDGLLLFSELQKSRKCFVLECELHAVYLVTPYSVCYQLNDIDWLFYLDLWEKLTPAMKKVGELVGVKESFLVRAMRGQTKLDYKLLQIHKRFYIALALQELVNETPISKVARKYKCNRGMLQSLQQMSSTFAGIVASFCNSLQWSTLALIVSQFKERLYFGIHCDLIDLMRLPDLTQKLARSLFESNIKSLVELAKADILTIERILFNCTSFESLKKDDKENSFEAEKRNTERLLFITGKFGITVTEAAQLLIKQARLFVKHEIGVDNIKWEENTNGTDNDGHMNFKELKYQPKCYEKDKPIKDCTKREMKTSNENKDKTLDFHILNKESNTSITGKRPLKISCPQNTFRVEPSKTVKDLNKSHQSISEKNGKIVVHNFEENNIVKENFTESKYIINDQVTLSHEHYENKKNPKSLYAYTKQLEFIPKSFDVQRTIKDCIDIGINNSTACSSNTVNIISIITTTPATTTTTTTTTTAASLPKNNSNNITFNIDSKENLLNCSPNHLPKKDSSLLLPKIIDKELSSHKISNEESKMNGNNYVDINDLFMEDSFELNSNIINILEVNNAKGEPVAKKNNLEILSNISPSHNSITELTNSHNNKFVNNHSEKKVQNVKSPKNNAFLQPLQNEDIYNKKGEPISIVDNDTTPLEDFCSNSSIEFSDLSVCNSLIRNPVLLNNSHILSCSKIDNKSSSLHSIDILDICGDLQLFKMAIAELSKIKRFGFCIGVQRRDDSKTQNIIGGNVIINQKALKEAYSKNAIKFEIHDSTYLAGIAFCIGSNVVYYMNMQEEGTCKGLTSEMKCESLRSLINTSENTLLIFNAKEQLKILRKTIPKLDEIEVCLEDPNIANWLLQPDKMLSLEHLAQQFAPECLSLVKLCCNGRGYISFGLDWNNGTVAKLRSSIEACVNIYILEGQIENLKRIGNGELYKFFKELEMPLQHTLCNMEVIGFPANENSMLKLYQQMIGIQKKLELRIYELNGSRFNLTSSSVVAKVLGLYKKSNGRISTSKQILEKIDSPISQLIIMYRKLSSIISTSIQPLLKCIENNRIYGQNITFTSTGRISMTEPSLQNVAKEFLIDLGNAQKENVCCRSAFSSINIENCLLSSDYCQLEMRILAHLSQDSALLEVINSKLDIFIAIAAKWNKIEYDNVSETLRNCTKQICYGIVYGIGMRSLAESLKCTEKEAVFIFEQFNNTYPGIRLYNNRVIKFAREHGYVETITGRRRYLEHINSGDQQLKQQAERQAINATIQGSAADITKSAMLRIQKNFDKYCEKLGISHNAVNLVLHLHDELIFEVPEDKAKKIAKILRITMQNCVKLSVPLKVKIQVGKTWGTLKELIF